MQTTLMAWSIGTPYCTALPVKSIASTIFSAKLLKEELIRLP
jgi:hypothetical protein